MTVKAEDLYEMMPVRVKGRTYGVTESEQRYQGQEPGSICYVSFTSYRRSGGPAGRPRVALYQNDANGTPLRTVGWYFTLDNLSYVFPFNSEQELVDAWSID